MAAMPGEITFAINSRLLSGGVTASDAEVGAAVAFAFRELKLVVEPGGAVGLAALLAGQIDARGKTVVIVLSGGNVDAICSPSWWRDRKLKSAARAGSARRTRSSRPGSCGGSGRADRWRRVGAVRETTGEQGRAEDGGAAGARRAAWASAARRLRHGLVAEAPALRRSRRDRQGCRLADPVGRRHGSAAIDRLVQARFVNDSLGRFADDARDIRYRLIRAGLIRHGVFQDDLLRTASSSTVSSRNVSSRGVRQPPSQRRSRRPRQLDGIGASWVDRLRCRGLRADRGRDLRLRCDRADVRRRCDDTDHGLGRRRRGASMTSSAAARNRLLVVGDGGRRARLGEPVDPGPDQVECGVDGRADIDFSDLAAAGLDRADLRIDQVADPANPRRSRASARRSP